MHQHDCEHDYKREDNNLDDIFWWRVNQWDSFMFKMIQILYLHQVLKFEFIKRLGDHCGENMITTLPTWNLNIYLYYCADLYLPVITLTLIPDT